MKNKKYRKWVASLDCYYCGAPADDAHHIIGIGGFGGMGMKAPDVLTMPLCRGHHTQMHNTPEMWKDQPLAILKTIIKAMEEGKIEFKG